MNCRRGSFLFICIALSTLMIIICVEILSEVRLESDTSVGNQRYILAEAAARAGLDHALEQILSDYQATTMNFAHAGMPDGMSLPSVTCLDGPYRAAFESTPPIYWPTSGVNVNLFNGGTDGNGPHTDDSVLSEHSVLLPFVWSPWDNGQWWSWMNSMEYDGRGRYYEPNFYNVTRPPLSQQMPVLPTSFTSVTVGLPERSQGMFYDDQFRRIPSSGNLLQDRQTARYRLRYALGVEDLSGHLLINPVADMHLLTSSNSVDYRTPAANYPWMPTAINVVGAFAGTQGGGVYAAEVEHVFQGRGYRTNVDLDHTSSGISGFPKTFPLMYRDHPDPSGSGCWGIYDEGPTNPNNPPNNLFWQQPSSTSSTVKGLAIGGEPIWPGASNEAWWSIWPYCGNSQLTLSHCLMGPQLSFSNTAYAMEGESSGLGHSNWDRWVFTPFGHGLSSTGYVPYSQNNKWYQGRVDTPFYINVLTVPPAVTNAMIGAYIPPRETNWADGSVQYFSDAHQRDGWGNELYNYVGSASINPSLPSNFGGIYGRDLLVDTTTSAFSQWPAQQRDDTTNPPAAVGIGQVVKPDYYVNDARPIIATYPGAAMNGQDGTVVGTGAPQIEGTDNLGANLDTLARCTIGMDWGGFGLDHYTSEPFWKLNSVQQSATCTQFGASPPPDPINDPAGYANWVAAVNAWTTATTPPPAGWGSSPGDYVAKNPTAEGIQHNQSYYFDLGAALAAAIGIFRQQHIALPTNSYSWGYNNACQYNSNPWTNSPYLTPENYQTIRDLDRLFLAELGESLDAPGTGNPQTLTNNGTLFSWYLSQNNWDPQCYAGPSQYTSPWAQMINNTPIITPVPTHNIFDLVQNQLLHNSDNSLSDIQRAHVMELMLNDFRMSFFGCNPTYSDATDPTKEFRPLDFLGDGRAYCSCYQGMSSGTVTTTDPTSSLPWATPGTKPPIYWTVTGTFFIGKSHYYRVLCRGEVWDNLKSMPTDEATVDSAVCVDPEGTDPSQTQMLYQRWAYDRYVGQSPRVQR